MKTIRAQQTSFAYGELSPSTNANQDASWFNQGCKTVQNYIPLQTGAVMRRAGMVLFDFLNEEKRLEPYVSSTGEQLIIAIGGDTIEVYSPSVGQTQNAGVTIQMTSPYAKEDIDGLNIIQVKGRLYISSYKYRCRYLELQDTGVVLVDAVFNTNEWNSSTNYEVNDIVSYGGFDFIANEAGIGVTPSADPSPWQIVYEGTGLRGEGRSEFDSFNQPVNIWDDSQIKQFTDNMAYSSLITGSFVLYGTRLYRLLGSGGNDSANAPPWKVWTDCPTEWPNYPKTVSYTTKGERGSPPQTYYTQVYTCSDELDSYVETHRMSLVSTMLDGFTGDIQLYIDGNSYNDGDYVYTGQGIFKALSNTTVIPSKSTAQDNDAWTLIGASASSLNNDYPNLILWHNSRLYAIGNSENPTYIWGSTVNDFENFFLGTEANESLSIEVSGTNGYPLIAGTGDKKFIVATTQSEFYIYGSSGVITPTDILVSKESGVGVAPKGFFESGADTLLIQRSGNRIFYSSYNDTIKAYDVGDLTVLASHLFEDKTIKELIVQKVPEQVIWVLMTDGTLLSGTHYINDRVIAWAHHETQGVIRSIAVLPTAGSEDQIYLQIQREDTEFTYETLEYFDLWQGDIGTDFTQIFTPDVVDAGGVIGLDDMSVQVQVNGARLADTTVIDSVLQTSAIAVRPRSTSLANPNVYIGLGYDAILTPQVIEPLRSRNKASTRVSSVGVKMYQASGVEVGVYNYDKISFRFTNSIMGYTIAPYSGEKDITVNSDVTDEEWMSVAQFGPFRGRLLGVFYELQVGGQ